MKITEHVSLWYNSLLAVNECQTCVAYFFLSLSQLIKGWAIKFHKILIQLTAEWHLDRKERSDKVLLSYKIPHIRAGWYNNTRDCRVFEKLD